MYGRERRVEGPNLVHWYGPLGETADTFPDAGRWTQRAMLWGTRDSADTVEIEGERLDCGLWRVSSYGFAAVRTNTGGRSLTQRQLRGLDALPAGTALVQRPAPLWIEIENVESVGRSIRIDAGQTVFLEGSAVNVRWWAPGPGNAAGASWIDLGSNADVQTVVSFEAPVSEGLLFVQVARVEVARQQGQDFALLTETYLAGVGIEPNQFRRVAIPPGARRVYVARDNTGIVTATRLEVVFSNGVTDQRLTTIPITDSQSSFGPEFVANATHVLLPLLAEQILWTLHWEIAT